MWLACVCVRAHIMRMEFIKSIHCVLKELMMLEILKCFFLMPQNVFKKNPKKPTEAGKDLFPFSTWQF